MAMDFIGLSVGMGYTDETVIGGGALKGKNCVVSNIEEVADGVNVTFQWTLDDGTVKTNTAFIPRGTQGEAGVDGKSAYEIWLEAGNTGTEEDFLISLVGEKGADGTMTFADLTEEQKESLKGADGQDGVDGVSPLVETVPTATGNTINITDKDGLKSFDVVNGLDGADGFAPVVTVTDIEGGHKVSIEDSEGVKEFEVLDGVNGTEIIHTDLTDFDGITTVLGLVNALLEEYRTERKNVRFECGSLSNTNLTDLPQPYGYLTIKVGGTNILEVTFAYSNLGFKKMYYGFLDRTSTETLYSSLDWEEVNTGAKAEIPIIENGKDVVQHKITKNRSITELESYTDRNGGTGYKIDDLYLTYDCEKLAKGFDDWFAEKGITPVKGETYEDVAQIQVYSPSVGGYVYLSTHIKFDNITYFVYNIKYNDTDYAITSVQYDHTNGKTPNTFTGLNVFNIAKIIPELAGCYIQSDILDVLHNWFELYKPIGLADAVGLYSKEEALTTQDLIVNAPIESRTVGPFDLGNIVSLMTSPLQKLLFSVDSEGKNLKAFANDEKNRTTLLTNGLFSGNLLASKNIFATLNDMSTLPTPPDGALGIWTVVPDAPGQPESTNKGGTLIIAHITSMLYSQTINYIGTRIAIYVTQGAIYYALGYGGKYYPTASWTPASGGAFRWYKISSTLV